MQCASRVERFTFDFKKMQRVKIQDEFDFPPTLDVGALLGTAAGTADASAGMSRTYLRVHVCACARVYACVCMCVRVRVRVRVRAVLCLDVGGESMYFDSSFTSTSSIC